MRGRGDCSIREGGGWRVAALLPIFALVSGCMITPGASTLRGELDRLGRASDFAIVTASPQEAVIEARGRSVVVTPGPGSCINPDTIDLGAGSAFMLLTDCAVELGASAGKASATRAGERLHLDHGFPGLVTVSVSGAERGTLESLERFIASDAGKARLARGSDGTAVEIAEMREVGDALFVLARALDDSVPLLTREFWRAFIELNDRLVLVTVSAFQANEIDKEAMFRQALEQVQAMRQGNDGMLALSPSGARTAEFAEVRSITPPAPAATSSEPAQSLEARAADVEPPAPAATLPVIEPRTKSAGGGALPPRAPGRSGERRPKTASGPVEAGPNAPESAPRAPRRRGA